MAQLQNDRRRTCIESDRLYDGRNHIHCHTYKKIKTYNINTISLIEAKLNLRGYKFYISSIYTGYLKSHN